MSDKRHAGLAMHSSAEAAKNGLQRHRLLARVRKYVLVFLGLLGLGGAVVIGLRFAGAQTLDETRREQAALYVNVVKPRPLAAENLLTLPATLQGQVEAPIYARVNGYLGRWYKDIGEPVKQGELLAQIEVPELAQQVNEASANRQLAQTSFERWEALRKRDAVSQQEFEEKRNALATATATLKRLQEQVAYSRITAPFSGIVTRRNVDVGNLVDAGSGTKVLFVLAKTSPLHLYVYVPQAYARQIKVGDKADVGLKEMAAAKYAGSIVRTARAIDPASRTLQVEIALPNADGKLLPGAYVQVALRTRLDADSKALLLPGNALLFRPDGPRAAVVDAEGKVHLRAVVIGRELGTDVELSGGLAPDDRVILNPPDALNEGDAVSVIEAKPAAAAVADKKS